MARTAVVIVREVMEHQKSWGGAFAEGLRRHGWHADLSAATAPPRCDLLVLWGVRNQAAINTQNRTGGQVCILERGYIGDRFRYSSVSFGGGLNGRGDYRGRDDGGARWERHFSHLMSPWVKDPQGYALVMGQVPGDNSIRGVDIEAFYAQAQKSYRASGWETRFRPHPHVTPRDGGQKIADARWSLEKDMSGAAFVVTWNSNSAVDAVMLGVPAVAMDQGSMAWAVTGHKLGEVPPAPDRTAWARWLARTQWTKDEMASGECWASVGAS